MSPVRCTPTPSPYSKPAIYPTLQVQHDIGSAHYIPLTERPVSETMLLRWNIMTKHASIPACPAPAIGELIKLHRERHRHGVRRHAYHWLRISWLTDDAVPPSGPQRPFIRDATRRRYLAATRIYMAVRFRAATAPRPALNRACARSSWDVAGRTCSPAGSSPGSAVSP